jgi:Calcineurin-like phosphoesterase
LNIKNYFVVILFAVTFSSFTELYNNDLSGSHISNKGAYKDSKFIQNSYAFHEGNDKDIIDETKDFNKKEANSIFNIAAVGDFDCNGDAKETVENIIEQNPELVLALGDFSYSGDADCWLELIEPVADKTKIVIGNHEVDSDELTEDYLNHFGLQEQYYSFNYKNMHFLALATETDYDEYSEQYQFAIQDFEKYSKDPFIEWIIVFYHDHMYGSGSLEEETNFREIYHPLFDKYKVDLALQGHHHVYERTYPITFNQEDNDEPIVHNNISNIYKNPIFKKSLANTFDNKTENVEFLAQYGNPNIYESPKGTVFVTVGTGGAHDMVLSSLEDFSAEGIDGTFGILDIALQADQKTLTGNFIENGNKKEVMDEFKIVKEKT